MPRVVASIRRPAAVDLEEVAFVRRHTNRPIKITVPGPFALAKLALDEHYQDFEALVQACAGAVNDELREVKAAGADIVQIDKPYL